MKKVLVALLLILGVGLIGNAQDRTLFSHEKFIHRGDTLNYRMLLPENFDASQKYPVVVFLHGAGERGNDNEAQLVHGSKLFLEPANRKNFPAIVIFPQCPKDSYWANVKFKDPVSGSRFDFQEGGEPTRPMKLIQKLLKEVRSKRYADKNRFYVAGLSMGGMGTYEILRRQPKFFAAAIAICGGDNVSNVAKYKKVPLWVFHGAKDNVVLPIESERVVNERAKLGYPAKFTLYPEANHNSWDPAFAEPEFLNWLFSHERK